MRSTLAVACCCLWSLLTTAVAAPLPERVEFNAHIRPLLAKHCVACHGGVKRAAGLSFIYRDKALAETESGMRAIVPGDCDNSYLLDRVAEPDPELRMPPAEHGRALSADEVALLKGWIEHGALWQEHWAYVAPQATALPQVSHTDWPRSSLDYWVLEPLEAAGMEPAPEADRREWLRRVTFDLTGLPPTVDALREFAADDNSDAYEGVVDRLLASPAFGERWASVWMDLARYADTMGYEKDPHRDMWPYRDWLIRALNADMPYDEFTIKQLAGDLLPDATVADRVATAFHRNTQTNTEGGTDDEEFRVAAVIDRVNTTWQVWTATTMGCTQCHAHPYEPIEHDEYYKFVAVMNTCRDSDVDEDLPRLAVPLNGDDFARASQLDREIGQLETDLQAAAVTLAGDEVAWQPLEIDTAQSTGQTKLEVVRDEQGRCEFRTAGTVTARSMFDLSGHTAEPLDAVTALRLDALPCDIAAALKTAEPGFVVSRLRVWLVLADGSEQELFLADAWCDDPQPTWSAVESLDDNANGWEAYSRLDRPRWAVFALAEPQVWPAQAKLKLQLKHERTATGEQPLVIQRGRVSVTSDPRWCELLQSAEYVARATRLAELRAEREAIASVSMPTIVQQPPIQQRETHMFVRGNWLDKGDHVTPGTPALFPPLAGGNDRLAMARWLVSGDHPLTGRVMVNRVWEQLFGLGIVETSEDFGTSGTLPTNQPLLDHLALRFQNDHAWHLKPLLREVVLSATYRQAARIDSDKLARDPRNQRLARGPRTRLSAEMVRDQALTAAGLLGTKLYGPSVMPPQPDGVWRTVYSGAQWATSEGEDRYRRALYTYWRRTSAYPSLMAFDAPSREVCTVRRVATNTPIQALVTLNDPVYLEAAAALAKRTSENDMADGERIALVYETVTSSVAEESQLAELEALYHEAWASFDPARAELQQLGASADEYALTIVASVILNLDAALTK